MDNSYHYQLKLHNLGGNERHAVKLKTGFLVSTSEDMPNSWKNNNMESYSESPLKGSINKYNFLDKKKNNSPVI